ncbi:BamA/TamA family outer membrane protein [Pinibacter soli]|uniref:BamA/TamA family outer membrane protein n=1 Tax=Pinibacter soli TaxID=3044211 RepID=A0ABT6RDZ2_9BACT|nr:BamA/TamA family outer membrane protein [Pinibacter soli]MDI3320740.1 BamA/TamA family outer membrane protein [Pinibacter soli]
MLHTVYSRKIICLVLFTFICAALHAQHNKKPVSTKDSLDGAFDVSDYLIEAHGFIPVPIIITEPAIGGFGGGVVPIFINSQHPYVDSVKGKQVITPVAPSITGGLAFYTINNTWLTGAFRSGTFIKSRIKYLAFGAYGNINMSFYRTLPSVGEKKFEFNMKMIPVLLQATKRIGFSHWYAGLRYLFLKTDVEYTGNHLLPPDFVSSKEYSSIVSQLGGVVELDNRDNTFTPNKGFKVHFDARRSDNIFGSDYDFWHLNYYMYAYKTISKKLVGGWRVDGQQSFGDQPFYLKPYIDMRGVPTARYQGNADLLTELEARWDFYKRWSIMLYGGTGKAFDEWKDFGSSTLVYTYGTGFRYLMARKFGLRMGVDVAFSNSDWAYYIVFGSNWLK